MLQNAAASVLAAVEDESPPQILYQLYYEQMEGSSRLESDGLVLRLPGHSHSLSFDDSMLGPVQQAWKIIMGEAADEDTYMAFVDREAADEDNELYD